MQSFLLRWIEVQGIKNSKAAEKINRAIVRKLTITKKLKASDCPSEKDVESSLKAFNNESLKEFEECKKEFKDSKETALVDLILES